MSFNLKKNNDPTAAPFSNLQQLYEFEFSPITNSKINSNGLYDTNEIMSHWSHNGIDIYLLYQEKNPIGFSVVNLSSMVTDDINTRDIAEFFIMPDSRKLGAGKWMAHEIFKVYSGKVIEIRQLPGLPAKEFWLKTIYEFVGDNFENEEISNIKWKGSLQRFISP